jgi:hypothetical protein
MKALKKTLATMVAICVLALSALALDAQPQNDPKPPPKQPKEIPQPKEEKPPPRNDNDNRGGNDKKRGRP